MTRHAQSRTKCWPAGFPRTFLSSPIITWAIILRSLVDRIELRPNQQGKLEIDLYGDLAGILSLAGKKDRPLDQNDPSVQQVKVVEGDELKTNILRFPSTGRLRAN